MGERCIVCDTPVVSKARVAGRVLGALTVLTVSGLLSAIVIGTMVKLVQFVWS